MTTTPQRRTRGSGSIRERAKGVWQIRYDGAPDIDGKTKKIAETVRGSKREAERVLRERVGAVDAGAYIEKSDTKVSEFMDRWLSTYVATNTSLKTQEGYRYFITTHINPLLGSIPLQRLTGSHVQQLYAVMLDKSLSAMTILHCHRILKGALSRAVQWGELIRNPADSATPPRPEKKELKTWDAETFQRFLHAARDSKFRDFYHLAALTGLRRSEICGLKWSDVDLDQGSLRVVRTLQRIEGMGLVEGQPKTARSRRTIALSPGATELLRSIRAQQAERRLVAGEVWKGNDHVFTTLEGAPIGGSRVSIDFAKIVREHNLPHLTLHGLRHTAASLMIAGNVHARAIADILGHSSISITMDVYGHLLNDTQRDAVNVLDEQLSTVK